MHNNNNSSNTFSSKELATGYNPLQGPPTNILSPVLSKAAMKRAAMPYNNKLFFITITGWGDWMKDSEVDNLIYPTRHDFYIALEDALVKQWKSIIKMPDDHHFLKIC